MNSRKLNICILNYEPFDPGMPARSEVTEIYGEYMPRFGHKLTWITPSGEKGKEVQEKFFKGVKIYTIPRPTTSFLPLKIFNFILYLLKEYRLLTAIFKKEKYDIIQARDDVFTALVALRIKKKYNIPLVFQYSFPKGVHNLQGLQERYLRFFGKFESRVTQYILRKADLVFPISKWMEAELIKEGIPQSKMMPLTMGVNLELFSEAKGGTNIPELHEPSKTILYAGTMDRKRELSILIRAFSKIREHKENVKLLMVGQGNDRTSLEELASRLGIQDDVIFTGQVPYFDMPRYISEGYVCVSPVPPLSIYKVSSPTKIFEYMAIGKPVVANEEIPEQKEVLEESGGGICVPFTPEAFAEAIIELINDPGKAAEMGRRGKEWVVQNRDYETLARQVEKRYLELLNQPVS